MKDKEQFSKVFKSATAEKVIEFLKSVTITNIALAKILKITPNEFSMIKNSALYSSITNTAWKVFADIANKKISVDSHFIKDCRKDPMVKINMFDYQTKYGPGHSIQKPPIDFDKEKHSNVSDQQPLKSEDCYSLEQTNLLNFMEDNPDVKAGDIISIWNQYHDYEPPKPPPPKAALTDKDIEMLKRFGMNFKRGIYLVHEDTVVELLAPVDLHNLLSQIIRSEFDRFINGIEWKSEDSVVRTLKIINKG